ncbi:hypothetical protein PIB30_005665 [Stylosanthes scabra]|uniref:Uncharacterized protein n=1 Tax=Stylosanthes scabra TaxID=79078 RepID=A0ABU6T573_9FABA|nr:hypothetical protein [Stylosanthes scabra]
MAEPQGDEVVREVEAAQMSHEPNPLHHWVTRDVMGSPCTLTEEYLAELKCSGVICGAVRRRGCIESSFLAEGRGYLSPHSSRDYSNVASSLRLNFIRTLGR